MSLPESLERAASELPGLADKIRPANGDPHRLLEELSATEAGKLLVWIINQEPDVTAELIEVWAETDPGAQIILSVSDDGIPKVARKMLRKAHHKLRSRGIEIVQPRLTSTATSSTSSISATRLASAAKDRWQAAHLSTPDFRGARVGYLVDSHPNGGARLFEVRFDESRGILDFKIYNAGRSKVRGFLRSLMAGAEQRLFEVDRDALRSLVRRASFSQPVDRPLPSSYVEWRGRLFSDDMEKAKVPGDLVREALTEKAGATDANQALETTTTEIRVGQLGPWPPKTAWVADWMASGREAVTDLEGEARSTAIDGWMEDATESLSAETDAGLLSHHLDEMAWIRWQTQDESGASALLAVSEASGKDAGTLRQLNRARVDGLFASFLTELRVIEVPGLSSANAEEANG